MYASINDGGDWRHDPALVAAVVAAFVRQVERERARGRNLRRWVGGATVDGRDYDGDIDLVRRRAKITRR